MCSWLKRTGRSGGCAIKTGLCLFTVLCALDSTTYGQFHCLDNGRCISYTALKGLLYIISPRRGGLSERGIATKTELEMAAGRCVQRGSKGREMLDVFLKLSASGVT